MSHSEPKLLEDQVAVHLGVHTTQGTPPALENESLLALVDLALPIHGKGSSFVSDDAPQGCGGYIRKLSSYSRPRSRDLNSRLCLLRGD